MTDEQKFANHFADYHIAHGIGPKEHDYKLRNYKVYYYAAINPKMRHSKNNFILNFHYRLARRKYGYMGHYEEQCRICGFKLK